jgi:hypothetical protein
MPARASAPLLLPTQLSFGLNADVTGDATTWTAGLRFQF